MDGWAGIERVVDYYFLPILVGCDDEPMLVVVVDQKYKFFVEGVIFPEVALVVEEDSCF